jgi:hypothetical protein
MSLILFALALIVSYVVLGAGIKLLDLATEFPVRFQTHLISLWVVTCGLAILVNIWVFFDLYTAILVIGIILGLIVTRKVDSSFFLLLAITTLPLSFFQLLVLSGFLMGFPTLIIIFVVSIMDELLHSKASQIAHSTLRWAIFHRPLLKITVLILPFFGLLTLFHAVAFWGFDIAYDFISFRFRANSSSTSSELTA